VKAGAMAPMSGIAVACGWVGRSSFMRSAPLDS
jgi:hypothetical protein